MKHLVFAVALTLAVAGCGDADPIGTDRDIVSNECTTHPDCREYGAVLDAPVYCDPVGVCALYEIECETVADCAPWTWYDLCEQGLCRHSFRNDPR